MTTTEEMIAAVESTAEATMDSVITAVDNGMPGMSEDMPAAAEETAAEESTDEDEDDEDEDDEDEDDEDEDDEESEDAADHEESTEKADESTAA